MDGPEATSSLLDTRVEVSTPEGVALTLIPAGPVPRAAAWLIDQSLRLGLYVLAQTVLTLLQSAGMGLLLLIVFLVEWFYPVLFEVLNRGATPGKAALGLTVVEANSRPVGWTASTVRNFLRFADFLPVGYGFGLLSMLSTRRFQRLGDLAAGTLVIHRHRPPARSSSLPETEPCVPRVALDREEVHTLIALATRHRQLGPDRLDELAAIAPALTGDDPARQRERLLGIARHLAAGHAERRA